MLRHALSIISLAVLPAVAAVNPQNNKQPQGPGIAAPAAGAQPVPDQSEAAGIVLGIEGTTFTINGKKTFLLGASYYGALGKSYGTICVEGVLCNGMDNDSFNSVRGTFQLTRHQPK